MACTSEDAINKAIQIAGPKVVPQMNDSGYLFQAGLTPYDTTWWVKPSEENQWSVTAYDSGWITVSYDLVVSGVLDDTGAAPHINGSMSFRVNTNGTIDYLFDRDGFPWAEAYFHNGQGGIQAIFRDPAVRGNPYDLFAIEPRQEFFSSITESLQSRAFGYPIASIANSFNMPGVPY